MNRDRLVIFEVMYDDTGTSEFFALFVPLLGAYFITLWLRVDIVIISFT